MKVTPVSVSCPDSSTIEVGSGCPLLLIAGPCVLESEELGLEVAAAMRQICERLGISYVFKASFDKANRTSISSYRGPGLEQGLASLARIRQEVGVPVISDIHEPAQAHAAAEVLDIIQIPAFLCRQTDLLTAASATGKPINLKKGQFVSPWEMKNGVDKIRTGGTSQVMLVERGASFGYNNLVVDMRSLPVMRGFDCPVIYDATHSVQLPGGAGDSSGGQREFIAPLSRAAVGAGVDGIFMEVHPNPEQALCDGPNSIALSEVAVLLGQVVAIHNSLC
ncbi:MAG: 3-deoxy-8-phosphooctulonate synthase [Desulfofustis sp.]|nr:3-deoxy-8-phosphooctulonate synthase [Desulfofustis sp.]MBT8347073.1 3-deoxy-8-phosphooctulonate synthase [Desulfofustis sp.]NNF45140.1 3-deoxy-8-phosphooctulonate synthase [Desulfofustis sp.]NNK14804.1 3-deoxy-8-phosphooctulonate synthase [Desulfofustis sp.]NNK58636.1 3-deoxy-8-phosphooctulonate synthase [Desulfofustis sp.]